MLFAYKNAIIARQQTNHALNLLSISSPILHIQGDISMALST